MLPAKGGLPGAPPSTGSEPQSSASTLRIRPSPKMRLAIGRLVAGSALLSAVAALEVIVVNRTSTKQAAAKVAEGIFAYHNSSSPAGQFNQPKPWFWWLSGNGWNGLLDYTVYTRDTVYQADILDALAKNVGDNFDFVPAEQASWEANDDQAYWVFNALTAIEYNFTALPCKVSGSPDSPGGCANSWLAISTNAFELFADRWGADAKTCGGGLKWQYNPKAKGYSMLPRDDLASLATDGPWLTRHQPTRTPSRTEASSRWLRVLRGTRATRPLPTGQPRSGTGRAISA